MASAPGAAVVWPQPAQIYADLFKLFKAFEACGYKWRCSVYGWSENVHGLQNSFTASPVLLPCSGAPSVPVPGLLRRLRALPRAVPPVSAGVPPFQAGSFPFAEAVFPFLEAFAPVTLGRMQGGIGADARLHSAGFHLASGQISLTRLLPHTGNRLSATAFTAAVTARQQARNASSVPIQYAFVPKLS